MSDTSCTAAEAIQRGLIVLNAKTGQYGYGAGDYVAGKTSHWTPGQNGDVPWTPSPDPKFPGPASDCAGFAISYCWKLVRHRPGFNVGPWASVADDINVNSAIEDGQHKQELFVTLGRAGTPAENIPQPGDLICYPTFYLPGIVRPFIGHVALIEDVPADYKIGEGWHRLTVLQCHGPDGFKPGVVSSDASHWDCHDHQWPKPEHRTVIVRPKTR